MIQTVLSEDWFWYGKIFSLHIIFAFQNDIIICQYDFSLSLSLFFFFCQYSPSTGTKWTALPFLIFKLCLSFLMQFALKGSHFTALYSILSPGSKTCAKHLSRNLLSLSLTQPWPFLYCIFLFQHVCIQYVLYWLMCKILYVYLIMSLLIYIFPI